MLNTSSRKVFSQLLRYAFFGVLKNSLGYSVYLLFTYFGVSPKVVISFLYIVGAIVGFWGNRKLIFSHQGSLGKAGVRYLIAHFFGYLLNLGILIVMVDKLGHAHQGAQIIAIFVVAGFLFITFKFFVFESTTLPMEDNNK